MAAIDYELPTPLAVSVADGRAVVRVGGDLDVLSTSRLADAFDVLARQRVVRIDVDLSDVPRLDSTAVELLAGTHGRLCGRGGRLRVVGASDRAAEVLRRRGLQGLLRAG